MLCRKYNVQYKVKGIWASGCVPDDWRKGIILPFYKGKGSRQECKNYRGITLLSYPGKVLAHLILHYTLHFHGVLQLLFWVGQFPDINYICTPIMEFLHF